MVVHLVMMTAKLAMVQILQTVILANKLRNLCILNIPVWQPVLMELIRFLPLRQGLVERAMIPIVQYAQMEGIHLAVNALKVILN